MMRNEILEPGQVVVLYYNGRWHGDSAGTGRLIKKLSSDAWSIEIDVGNFITWGMDDTNIEIVKKNIKDEIPF